MISFAWIAEHWGHILENAGIISGLYFTAHGSYTEARVRKVQNLVSLTRSHREIWSELYSQPGLARVLSPDIDVLKAPPTMQETLFVKFLMFHLATAYRASKSGFYTAPERLASDISDFLSLPIPAAVWARLRGSQDVDFVEFIETYR